MAFVPPDRSLGVAAGNEDDRIDKMSVLGWAPQKQPSDRNPYKVTYWGWRKSQEKMLVQILNSLSVFPRETLECELHLRICLPECKGTRLSNHRIRYSLVTWFIIGGTGTVEESSSSWQKVNPIAQEKSSRGVCKFEL